jgi:DNA-binding MarR family transcriptional regulator
MIKEGTIGNIDENDALNAEAKELERLYPAVYHRFQLSSQTIPGTGVTMRMLGMLQHLLHSGPLTLGELVAHLGLSKAAVTELADRVEAKNLTSRLRDDRDRRRVFIGLTEEGEQVAKTQITVLEEQKLVLAMRRMTQQERENLISGLRALLRADQEETDEREGSMH